MRISQIVLDDGNEFRQIYTISTTKTLYRNDVIVEYHDSEGRMILNPRLITQEDKDRLKAKWKECKNGFPNIVQNKIDSAKSEIASLKATIKSKVALKREVRQRYSNLSRAEKKVLKIQ
jgi:hypothetical protein